MFMKCTSFNQDLNKWKINNNVYNMRRMFYMCSSLTYIFNSWDIWYNINVTSISIRQMFTGCSKIDKTSFIPIKTGSNPNPKQTFLDTFNL